MQLKHASQLIPGQIRLSVAHAMICNDIYTAIITVKALFSTFSFNPPSLKSFKGISNTFKKCPFAVLKVLWRSGLIH